MKRNLNIDKLKFPRLRIDGLHDISVYYLLLNSRMESLKNTQWWYKIGNDEVRFMDKVYD